MNDQPEEAEDDHILEGRTLLSQSAPTAGQSPKARSGTAISVSSSGEHKEEKRSNGVLNRDRKKKKSSDEAKTNTTRPADVAEAAPLASANDEHKVVGEPAASVLKTQKHGNGGGELEESVELHSPLPRRLQDQNDVTRKSGSFKRSNNKDDNNSSSSSSSSSPDLPPHHKEDEKHKKKKEEKERRKERRESKADVCDHPRRASSELLRGGKGRTFWNRERTPRRGILVRSMSAEQLVHEQRTSFDGAEFKRKKHKKHKRKVMQDEGVKFDKVVVRHYPREICLGGCMLNPDQGPFLGIGWDWKQEEVHNLYSFERLREPLRHVAHAIPSGMRHELLLHYGLNEGEIQELVLEMKQKDKELQRGTSSSFLPSFWPWKKAG